ncbi:MAG: hypothetical protein ABL919_05440 [Methylococcales bacterium]|nr:hypothetical protein [Methylococcaceae bacterium]
MNTYLTHKRLLPTLALACLAPWVSQAEASATFSSFATVTYTITSLSNSANTQDFTGLGIAGSFQLAPDQATSTITGAGSVNPSATSTATEFLSPAIGSIFTRTFQLDGTASNGGEVAANYLAWFDLSFENTSATDSYDVGLSLSYTLSANATGSSALDNAFTDVTLNYTNENFDIFAPDMVSAASETINSESKSVTLPLPFNFTLAPAGTEGLYVDVGITGNLQASPVPVPSALWLFASALLAIPGVRKFKQAI